MYLLARIGLNLIKCKILCHEVLHSLSHINKTVIDVCEVNHVRTAQLKSNEDFSSSFEPVTSQYWCNTLTN